MTNDESMPNDEVRNRNGVVIIIPSTFVIREFVISSSILEDLLDRRVAGENAPQAVLAQRYHPELDRFFLQSHSGRAFVDQFAQRIGDLHQLVDALSAFVTS